MKKFAKLALGAALLAGAATAVAATPADARVSVGIGIGGPAYYGPAYYPRYSCDPYSRFYDPYYCGAYAPGYYYGPDFYLNYHTGWTGWHGGFNRGFVGGNFHGGTGFHGGSGFHGGGTHGSSGGHTSHH